jgi:hypothetical protein
METAESKTDELYKYYGEAKKPINNTEIDVDTTTSKFKRVSIYNNVFLRDELLPFYHDAKKLVDQQLKETAIDDHKSVRNGPYQVDTYRDFSYDYASVKIYGPIFVYQYIESSYFIVDSYRGREKLISLYNVRSFNKETGEEYQYFEKTHHHGRERYTRRKLHFIRDYTKSPAEIIHKDYIYGDYIGGNIIFFRKFNIIDEVVKSIDIYENSLIYWDKNNTPRVKKS